MDYFNNQCTCESLTPRGRQSGCACCIFALESEIYTRFGSQGTDLWLDVHRELNADADMDNNERLLREFGLLSDSDDCGDDNETMAVEQPVPVVAVVAAKSPRFHKPMDLLRTRILSLTHRRQELDEQRLELAENREEVAHFKQSFASLHRKVKQLLSDFPMPTRDYAEEYAIQLELNGWLQKKMIIINRWPEVLDQYEKLALIKHPLYHHSCLDNVLDLLDDTSHYSAMPQKESAALIRRLDSATLLMDVAAGRTLVKFIMDEQYYIFIAQEHTSFSILAYIVIRKEALVI